MRATPELRALAAGDLLVTAPRVRPDGLGWVEEPRDPDDPPADREQPLVIQQLRYGKHAFGVRTTLDDCFAAVRAVFITDGAKGIDALFAANDMVARAYPTGGVGVVPVSPLASLPREQHDTYRLLDRSRGRVAELARRAVEATTPLACAAGQTRLAAAHQEIENELQRYFTGITGPSLLDVALDERVSPNLFKLDTLTPDVTKLRTELRRCRPLVETARSTHTRWTRQLIDAHLDARQEMIGVGTPAAAAAMLEGRVAELADERHPELPGLRAAADEARDRLDAHVAVAALEFPILWRIFSSPHAEDTASLGGEMLDVLRATASANRSIARALRTDPERVWHYPSVVREALESAYVPRLSIAWMAAEEELVRVAGPRLSSQLGLLTGLASMGTGALALMFGTAAVSPPLLMAVLVADAVLALYDAFEDVIEYLRQADAAAAVLNPSRSLASEPNLFATVLSVALNLLSLLPGPAPRAGAVAP
jgi:hypothetical protein